jgi:hypothetical protein
MEAEREYACLDFVECPAIINWFQINPICSIKMDAFIF